MPSIIYVGNKVITASKLRKCLVTSINLTIYTDTIYTDKSLARPGRKQATATKFQLLQTTPPQKKKKFRKLSVQPGPRGSNDLRVGRKMATFQVFFLSGRAKDLSAPLYFMHL